MKFPTTPAPHWSGCGSCIRPAPPPPMWSTRAPSPGRSSGPRTAARPSSWCEPVGSPEQGEVGRRGWRAGRAHGDDRPAGRRRGDRRGLHRRRVPHRGRRGGLVPVEHRGEGSLPAGSASRVRPVRPQDRPGPGGPATGCICRTTAASTAATTPAPGGRTSAAASPRTSASPWPPTRGGGTSPTSSPSPPIWTGCPRTTAAGCTAPTMRERPGTPLTTACPQRTTTAPC